MVYPGILLGWADMNEQTVTRGLTTQGGHLLYFFNIMSVHWLQICTLFFFNATFIKILPLTYYSFCTKIALMHSLNMGQHCTLPGIENTPFPLFCVW